MYDAPEQTGPLLVDRRRHPRSEAPEDLHISIPTVSSAEVIDLSVAGALLSTPVPMSVGDRARLSVLLGREPFSAWVRVIRVAEGTRSGGTVHYHLGVIFTAIDDNSRSVLTRFVPPAQPRNA
jgi:hypothetical protein